MSYLRVNKELFAAAQMGAWFKRAAVRGLLNELNGIDYSVVETRREAHAKLRAFEQAGLDGAEIFGWTKRFPGEEEDVYYTDFDENLGRVLVGLANSLSWRTENVAKDVSSSKGGSREENYTERNQEVQDQRKRYEELVRNYRSLLVSPDNIWIRESFEKKIAKWQSQGQVQVNPQP